MLIKYLLLKKNKQLKKYKVMKLKNLLKKQKKLLKKRLLKNNPLKKKLLKKRLLNLQVPLLLIPQLVQKLKRKLGLLLKNLQITIMQETDNILENTNYQNLTLMGTILQKTKNVWRMNM